MREPPPLAERSMRACPLCGFVVCEPDCWNAKADVYKHDNADYTKYTPKEARGRERKDLQ